MTTQSGHHPAFPPNLLFDPYPMNQVHERPQKRRIETMNSALRQCLDEVGHHLKKPLYRTELNYLYRQAKRIRTQQISLSKLSDDELREQARTLSLQIKQTGITPKSTRHSFALTREATQRTLGFGHHDEQLIGGWIMWQGKLAEMETGQGKTVTATLPAIAAALAGVPTHVITVNDYLAKRDADTLAPIYELLGISVGSITESLQPDERREIYRHDVVYCSNKTIVFDHLRDRMETSHINTPLERHLCLGNMSTKQDNPTAAKSTTYQPLLRGLCFAIVDEADSILIDEAVTPLIISKNIQQSKKIIIYQRALEQAQRLQSKQHFIADYDHRRIHITEEGRLELQLQGEQLGGLWRNQMAREELVIQALKAEHLFIRDRHYLIKDNKVQIIDEFTGRVMPDRSWERGLHQMIELKERCEVTADRVTQARLSYQRFFRRYLRLAGMTGTAQEVRRELLSTYHLPVFKVPTAQKVIRKRETDRIALNQEQKWSWLLTDIENRHQNRQPILIGTRSVEASEQLSQRLTNAGLPHTVLNARQDEQEAEIVANAGQPGQITVATNMAGRGTDIKLAESVKALGGLHVIATERHESRRIDRQLLGRCGRQGDPGSAIAIISLEDDLLNLNSPALLLKLTRLLLKQIPRLGQASAKLLVSMTQYRISHRQHQVRANVLRTDQELANLLAFSGHME